MLTADDPLQLVTAADLGAAHRASEDEVRQMRAEHKVFAVTIVSREEKRSGYPFFQASPAVWGEPLARVLAALYVPGEDVGPSAYGFFSSPTDLLDGLSPLEMLLGKRLGKRPLPSRTADLLGLLPAERLDAVAEVAKTVMTVQAGWD